MGQQGRGHSGLTCLDSKIKVPSSWAELPLPLSWQPGTRSPVAGRCCVAPSLSAPDGALLLQLARFPSDGALGASIGHQLHKWHRIHPVDSLEARGRCAPLPPAVHPDTFVPCVPGHPWRRNSSQEAAHCTAAAQDLQLRLQGRRSTRLIDSFVHCTGMCISC